MNQTPSFKLKFQYWFDNMMSRGTVAQIGLLVLLTIAIIVAAAVIISTFKINQEGAEGSLSFGEAAWASLMRTFDAGTMGGDTGAGFRFVMLFVTIGGIFVVSSLIGVLSVGVEGKLDELRKGRSIVLEQNHTVILGWSPQIYTIITELVQANANQRRPAIAILADRDKVEMEDELAARVPDTGNTRLICRSGSPIDPSDLAIVSPQTARSVIILPENDMPDASVVKAVLALTRLFDRPDACRIVTHVQNPRTLDVLELTGTRSSIHTLLTDDLIARVTAQTSRQSGLSVVYTELLNFGGDEIYFANVPALAGKTYGELLLAFEDSSAIGVRKSDGTVSLNPAMDTIFDPSDRVIALSADDDTIKPNAQAEVDAGAICAGTPIPEIQTERALILGWNERAPRIIRELDHYVKSGSDVVIVSDVNKEEVREQCIDIENQSLTILNGDTTERKLLDKLNITTFGHIIVLADMTLPLQTADARTMITLLHLRDIAEKQKAHIPIVSEMLDLRNRELASVADVDDFIVSDHLISLLMAQLSENGDLEAVFTDLFDPEGSEIYLKPAGNYVEPGKAVNFYTVVEAARQRGETAIGYRHYAGKNAGDASSVHTNPKKSEMITFSKEDKIIVLADN